MKTLKFKESGAVGQFQDIDALDLLKSGEYEEVTAVLPATSKPVPDRVAQLESELAEAKGIITNLQDRIADLEDDTPAPAPDELTARINSIQAKKDSGTATNADNMLLGRLLKKRDSLQVQG